MPVANDNTPIGTKQRLNCVDALRGFDMFWIVGGDSLAQIFTRFGDSGRSIANQFEHAEWEGFHFEDLIFPLFVFIAGMSLVFSLGGKMADGGRRAAAARLARRAFLLFLLGVLYYRGTRPETFRLLGVLQRIGIAYFGAGILYLFCKPRSLIVWCVAILMGYWALLALVPVPGIGPGNFAEGKNLTNWVDEHYLPGFKWDGKWDPEGLLSTLPAVGSCLLGVFAGLIVRDPRKNHTDRIRYFVILGLTMLAIGYGWGFTFPIIKKLWTSSFVCFAGGWSFLLLALFYYLIDVRGWQRWSQPFVWIGMNSIAIYLIRNIVGFKPLAMRLTGGSITNWLDGALGLGWGNFTTNLIALGLCLWLAYFLHARKIFLRV